MGQIKPLACVFLDTNILKFSAVKKHVYRKATKTVVWGETTFEAEYHEPHTVNEIHQIKSEVQKRDALFLAMLAYAGHDKLLKFYIHREVDLETRALPGMASPSGRFFGCEIHKVPDPVAPQSRIVLGGGKKLKEHTLDFVCSIRHPRYVELTKMTGAYQGHSKPLNLNQALDAYHIWCAESAKMDYFLTMDYKLKKVVEKSKVKTSVSIVTPDQLLRTMFPKLGLWGAIGYIWRGYRFAKPRVGFDEGQGWR